MADKKMSPTPKRTLTISHNKKRGADTVTRPTQ